MRAYVCVYAIHHARHHTGHHAMHHAMRMATHLGHDSGPPELDLEPAKVCLDTVTHAQRVHAKGALRLLWGPHTT